MIKEIFFGLAITSVLAAILFFGARDRSFVVTKQTSPENTQVSGDMATSSSQAQVSENVKLDAVSIARHSTASDCWIIISGKVYNVSSFLSAHPGGEGKIIPYCGKDATAAFDNQGGSGQHSSSAQQMLADYFIGNVNSSVPQKTIQTIQNSQPTTVPKRQEREVEDDD